MAKPVFPSTNQCGQLFNDYLNEKPILKIYSAPSKGKVTWKDRYSIEIDLLQSEDRIHITHRNGKITCIEYETTAKDLIEEMVTFLDTHFEKEPALERSKLDVYDVYNAEILVSVIRMGTTHYIGIRIF